METAVAEKQAEEEQAADQERILDTLLSKRTQYTQRRDDISKRIRELGSLPTEAFEKYRSKSTKELHRMLKQVAEELKQFSHVNKKALDQYVTFTEQREDLLKRQKELQSGGAPPRPAPTGAVPRGYPGLSAADAGAGRRR